MKVVVLRVVEVEQANDVVSLLLAIEEAYLDARLQVIVEGFVALFKRSALDVLDFKNRLVDCSDGEALVDAREGVLEDARQEYIAVLVRSAGNVRAV